MAGNKAGGKTASQKILARDPEFYIRIGRKGGQKTGIAKGFALNRELAKIAGANGGRISRRRKTVTA